MHLSIDADNDGSGENESVGRTRVLVIDDDQETTDMLKLILEPSAFEVVTTNSGSQGIEMARKLNLDVVIVDLLMPGMNGLQVCEAVRKFSGVPILVLSAVSKPGIVAQALNNGADDFMLKPMKSSLLIASINKLARRARAEQEAFRRNGAYRMA